MDNLAGLPRDAHRVRIAGTWSLLDTLSSPIVRPVGNRVVPFLSCGPSLLDGRPGTADHFPLLFPGIHKKEPGDARNEYLAHVDRAR
jgi:hypothetical protein